MGERSGAVTVHDQPSTMDHMTNTTNTRTLRIIAAAALSLSIVGAGATYAFASENRSGHTKAGTIYSDVGINYGAYDFSGSKEEELPVWDGKLS